MEPLEVSTTQNVGSDVRSWSVA